MLGIHGRPATRCIVGMLVAVVPLLLSGMRVTPRVNAQAVAPDLASEACTARGQVGTVKDVSKGLRLKHGRNWANARKGTLVYNGDSVQTRAGQKGSISLCGGGSVYVNSRSDIVMKSRTDVVARRGEVAERTASTVTQGVRTGDAMAQGRASYFDVQAKKGQSVYVVASGALEVKNKHGKVRVTSNHKTSARSGRAPAAPTAVDAQQTLRWAAPLSESWRILTAPSVVLSPFRLVVDSGGNIYVTDPAEESRVVKLSPGGKLLATWHLQGRTTFPSGIAIDRQNNLYVTDRSAIDVEKMTLDGRVLAVYDLQKLFPDTSMSPSGIEVDGAGNMYVADVFLDKVLKLSPDGKLLAAWGTEGSGPGQFNTPSDLAVDAAGNIYVADTTNYRIQKLSPTGQVLGVWNLGAVSPPYDVTVDALGNVYIAASNPERIQEFSSNGHTIRTWKNQPSTLLTAPGEFDRPFGVALDARGNIYVVDHYGARIEKLTRG